MSSNAVEVARKIVADLKTAIGAHLDDGNRGEILRDGFRIVLAGPPNAGKSSLLNALARRDAAIVSEEAGTTRDVIEVRLDLDGLPVIVSDTAGIRTPQGAIEKEGIRRTLARARDADLVVWLSEASESCPPPPGGFSPRGQVFPARGQQNRSSRHRAARRDAGVSAKTGVATARAHAPPGRTSRGPPRRLVLAGDHARAVQAASSKGACPPFKSS